jgi:hypothetical protein
MPLDGFRGMLRSGPERCFFTFNGDAGSPPGIPSLGECCKTGSGPDLWRTLAFGISGAAGDGFGMTTSSAAVGLGEDSSSYCSLVGLNSEPAPQRGSADSTDFLKGVCDSGVVNRLLRFEMLKDLRLKRDGKGAVSWIGDEIRI